MIRSRESAIVRMVPSYALAVQLEAQRAAEVAKGCEPTIWPQPVALEPLYTPFPAKPGTHEDNRHILTEYEGS
jgi:hypothetical protein